ncbi:MAG: DUF2098 domain-containing protein [Methanomassiliicoccaceae archaeon]|nr:DUF2098 domain-containing protein [Methanomassiliicoccaceae archaeon]
MKVGDICKYMPTSTVGKITDVRSKDGREWALLDFSGLYYDVSFLTPADKSEYREVSYKERERDREQKLRSVEEFAKTAEDVNIDMFMPSGGG